MKKILSIALVALLAASTVFAGFSGNAKVAFGYDTTSKVYGFKNSTGVDVNVDLVTAEADEKAEGDVYAGIKASIAVKLGNLKGSKGDAIWNGDDYKLGIGTFVDFAEAYVAGEGWKVSILGTQGAPDYAKSAIDTKKSDVKDIFGNKYDTKDVAVSYSVASNKAPGVTAEVKGFKASFGLLGDANDSKKLNYNAFVETPAFAFADGAVSAQFAAIASGKETTYKESGATYRLDTTTGLIVVDTAATKVVDANAYDAFGASAKASYENDTFKASFGTDFGAKKERVDGAKFVFGLDAAANFVVDPVTFNVYYKNEDFSKSDKSAHLLSANAAVDLNAFDVPVSFTFTGKDLVNKQDLSVKAAFNITEELSADATVGYVISGDDAKKISAKANVAYAADAFTAKAGVAYSTVIDAKKSVLSATASVSSSAIIPGATLALEYGTDSADNDMNFLKDQATAQNFGAITASCKISF